MLLVGVGGEGVLAARAEVAVRKRTPRPAHRHSQKLEVAVHQVILFAGLQKKKKKKRKKKEKKKKRKEKKKEKRKSESEQKRLRKQSFVLRAPPREPRQRWLLGACAADLHSLSVLNQERLVSAPGSLSVYWEHLKAPMEAARRAWK